VVDGLPVEGTWRAHQVPLAEVWTNPEHPLPPVHLQAVHATARRGNLDPGLLVWLLQHGGLSLDEVSRGLEHAAGLAGLAALPDGSGDMREVRVAADAGRPSARLAIDVHTHRLRQQIAAMAAAMDGLDALVFTGGIGEHQPQVRPEAAGGLGFLGVTIDRARPGLGRQPWVG
jgi:acetate kinase